MATGTGVTMVPARSAPSQARRRPLGSNTADTPLTDTWTTDRPDSTARTAARLACCGWAQLPWKVVVADCTTTTSAPFRTNCRARSGKADSKHTNGPSRSRPECRTAGSLPRRRSSTAASVTLPTQPSMDRRGMYSPNGTSRALS